MHDSMTRVRFPEAPPAQYLRMAATLGELRKRTHSDPWLAPLARNAGAALTDEVAVFIFGPFACAICRQAERALEAGAETVAPEITATDSVVAAAARRMKSWAVWLGVRGPRDDEPRFVGTGLRLPENMIDLLARRTPSQGRPVAPAPA